MTAEQIADEFGFPGPRTVRTLMSQGLPAYKISKAYLFKAEDVEAFIENRRICHAPIQDHNSGGIKTDESGTSDGSSAADLSCAQQARQTAGRLKKSSRNISPSNSEGPAGRVIRAKFG